MIGQKRTSQSLEAESCIICILVSSLCMDSLKGMVLLASAHLAAQDESMILVFMFLKMGVLQLEALGLEVHDHRLRREILLQSVQLPDCKICHLSCCCV